MVKSLSSKDALLFSQSVDASIADAVRGITGKHDRFTTDMIGLIDDKGEVVMGSRLEAWKNALNDLWGLDLIEWAPALEGRFRHSVDARPGLCFADALARCARFQQTELAMPGHAVLDMPAAGEDAVHYRTAAKAAGQIIDDAGDYHPCAFGRPLTGGFFSEDDVNVAASTRGAVLAKPAREPALIALGPNKALQHILAVNNPVAPVQGENTLLALNAQFRNAQKDMAERRKLSAPYRSVVEIGDKLVTRLNHQHFNDFKSDFAEQPILFVPMALLGLMTCGIAPVVFHFSYREAFTVNNAFFSLKKKFARAAANLPDEDHRDRSIEFSRLAEQTFWLERAACIYQRAVEKGKPGLLDKGKDYVAKACAAVNMGETDRTRLMGEYLGARFQQGAFLNSLEHAWKYDLRGPLSRQAAAYEGPK